MPHPLAGNVRVASNRLTGRAGAWISAPRQLSAEARTPLPKVCGDLGAWKASGYATLPDTTVRFRRTFYEKRSPKRKLARSKRSGKS